MNSGQNHTETKTILKENGYKIEKNVPVPEFSKAYKFITRTVHGRGRAGKLLRVWRVTS